MPPLRAGRDSGREQLWPTLAYCNYLVCIVLLLPDNQPTELQIGETFLYSSWNAHNETRRQSEAATERVAFPGTTNPGRGL